MRVRAAGLMKIGFGDKLKAHTHRRRGRHPHRQGRRPGPLPSRDFAVNAAWLTAAMTGQILLAWLKLLALDGDLASAEPRALRYRVLHAAAGWPAADGGAA